MQLIMAGNDAEGLRYGSIQTPEKYYLTWKEESQEPNLLDRALTQMCGKARLLELVHEEFDHRHNCSFLFGREYFTFLADNLFL